MNGAAYQARSYADKATPTEVSSILEQRIRGVQEESNLAETGRVLSVGYVEPINKARIGGSLSGRAMSSSRPAPANPTISCSGAFRRLNELTLV
jgi:hypothetical protein